MKRILTTVLSFALILGLSVPALAAESLDSRLTKVTLNVKNTLDIGDGFENFDGTLSENEYTPYWSLNWYNDDGDEEIYVSANEDGKIFSYNYYNSEYYGRYRYSPYFEPAFPSVDRAEAKEAAMSFLSKVLDEHESVALEEYEKTAVRATSYSFYGAIYVNGLEGPFGVNITVNTSDLKVTSFSRDDFYVSLKGSYPSPEPTITSERAKELLSETYEFDPLYIIIDDSNTAKLVYLPQHSTNQVVDAITGELVETGGGYRPLYKTANNEADMATVAGRSLSPAELKGIAQLEDAYTPEQLDALLRKTSILDINSDFTLQDTVYSLNKETEEVYVNVSYQAQDVDLSDYGASEETKSEQDRYAGTPYIYKSITVNAKNGKILSVNTYYSGIHRPYEESEAGEIPIDVLSFIKSNNPDELAASEQYSSLSKDSGIKQAQYTYCHRPNGYFYTNNSINVTVNSYTGKLDKYVFTWDNDIAFEPVPSTITQEVAIKAYSDVFEYKLGYSLKTTVAEQYEYRQTAEIILSYGPYYKGNVTGVDAVTGELISINYQSEIPEISYNDLSGSYAEDKINTLAEYGVGYYSQSFKPNAQLTEKDMILLLISADGYKYIYDDIDEDELDRIYDIGYNLGILRNGEKTPDRIVTRAEMVRTLISMSGYGKAAEFKDIYICGFTDDDKIEDSDYGYIAIGKGLGLISGGSDNSFRPYEPVKRQDAAVMLYNFMSR